VGSSTTDEVEVAPLVKIYWQISLTVKCRWFRAWQLAMRPYLASHLTVWVFNVSSSGQLAEIWQLTATNLRGSSPAIRGPFDKLLVFCTRWTDWAWELGVLKMPKIYSVTDWLDKKGAPGEQEICSNIPLTKCPKRLVGMEILHGVLVSGATW